MKNDSRHEGERWFAQAKRDFDDAVFSRDGGRFNLACFLAQQAAEKSIKAFLYSRGAELVWGHSVAELCHDATGFDAEFARLKTDAATLDKYYIPTRYPDGLPGGIPADAYQKEDAASALERAGKIIDFVEGKLK
ncbi:MAG: HEPN domain-containing protein [Bacillota bacterium]